MNDNIKLIIEIDPRIKYAIQNNKGVTLGNQIDICNAIKNGIPLDNDSERAETQAYFAGEAYGWEQGRKALIDDVKAEIEQLPLVLYAGYDHIEKDSVMQILDNICKVES